MYFKTILQLSTCFYNNLYILLEGLIRLLFLQIESELSKVKLQMSNSC